MKQTRRTRMAAAFAAVIVLQAVRFPAAVLARPARPETWRYDMVQTWHRDQPGAKQHTRRARMWVKGKKMRREEGNMVTIVADGWQYILEKDRKKGIQQPAPKQGSPALSIPSPSEFARHARRHGKKVGAEQIAGQRMTVYQLDAMRVWVGSDGLVHKTAGRHEGGGVWSWEMRNLRRGIAIPDSMFRPPSDYKVRQVMVFPSPSSKSRRP